MGACSSSVGDLDVGLMVCCFLWVVHCGGIMQCLVRDDGGEEWEEGHLKLPCCINIVSPDDSMFACR